MISPESIIHQFIFTYQLGHHNKLTQPPYLALAGSPCSFCSFVFPYGGEVMPGPFIGYLTIGTKYEVKPRMKGIEFPNGSGTKASAVVMNLLRV
jgi:hypothetical protein